MGSECRRFNPVRIDKRAFRQEHVSASLRRAVQQSRGAKWPSATPAAPTSQERSTAPAMGTGRGE